MNYLEYIARLEQLDKTYLWHPFTQMKEWVEAIPFIFSEGRGCFLKDVRGRWYLDGISSLWVNLHGHKKKDIDDAIKLQLSKIAHATLLGASTVPSIELAEKLIGLTDESFASLNPRLSRVFYSDDGSTSVEVALKMACQYWGHKGFSGKHGFLCLNNAYHGDTIGAVSVGGISIFHNAFKPLLFATYRAPSPYCYRCEINAAHPDCSLLCLSKMHDTLKEHADKIAAVIIEPMVQAAGGIIVSPLGYLRGVRELCDRYNVLMIADEVATGFGRTGKMFACEHEAVVPDIMCLSKGITNGYMPLAVTLTTDDIFNAFLGEFRDLRTFFHGHSYSGNPLACAAALASITVFKREEVMEQLGPKIRLMETVLSDLSQLAHVGDVRNKGLIAGIELVRDKTSREPYRWEEKIGWRVVLKARAKGIFLRPLGNVVVAMPPLCITPEHLKLLMNVIKTSIIAVTDNA